MLNLPSIRAGGAAQGAAIECVEGDEVDVHGMPRR